MSPLLFSLLIDRVEAKLQEAARQQGRPPQAATIMLGAL